MAYPRIPASTEEAIFAAQEGLAPSQIMPDTMAKRVDKRMIDRFQITALQISDAAAGRTAGAHRAAISGQPSDSAF